MLTKHLKITGRVQGVGFRYSMLNAAHNFKVFGWVKNCPDGSVEAIVHGSDEQLNNIINWARHGPSMADVDSVEVSDSYGSFADFKIIS